MKMFFDIISLWILPSIIMFVIVFGLIKKIPVYEAFIDGAKEGFNTGVRIIPYLVAIMVAVGMFRASGALDIMGKEFKSILDYLHFPVDTVPLAIIRPLSGSGALGIFSEIAQNYGGNHPITLTAAVMIGCSETTFYVLSVYFGAVGIKKFRHALPVGIIADLAGLVAALWLSNMLFY